MRNDVQADHRLEKVKRDFLGLDTRYPLVDGRETRRIYLDSTASTLMMRAAHEAMTRLFDHYANTHTLLHYSAKIATREYLAAHARVLSFLGADPNTYACFFTGSGATAGINRMARVLRDSRPDRDLGLVSLMEHHSNDLPHRKHCNEVIHIPLNDHDGQPGSINLAALEEDLKKHQERVNYVAVTGVSNVTGIINPIHDIAELAHRYGALILIDGAQMVAHLPVQISGHKDPARDLDAFVFSGHKTYVPGSPGVVVCRRDILESIEPVEVGGGMVEHVYVDRWVTSPLFPDREEAGTPNIPGAIGLATALEVLDRVGFDAIVEEETDLINYALAEIGAAPGVVIYGESDPSICPRAASISFNISGMDHGLAAALLNDHFNIAVRNECFCAHPYVKEMVFDDLLESVDDVAEDELEEAMKLKSGMVRASFGIYNTREDVDALVAALNKIVETQDELKTQYSVDGDGNYVHHDLKLADDFGFSISAFAQSYLEE